MAIQFGHMGEFEEGREEWTQYAERLGHFLTANGITDGDKKRAVFLSVIGPKAYKLLGSLIAPAKPGRQDVRRVSGGDDAASQPTALRDCTEVQVPHTATTAGRDNCKVCIGVALVGADVSIRNDTQAKR